MYRYLKSAFLSYVHLPVSSSYAASAPSSCSKDVHALKYAKSFPDIVSHSTKFAHHSVSGLAININQPAVTPFFVTIAYQYCHHVIG
jgi:hypothetical protein